MPKIAALTVLILASQTCFGASSYTVHPLVSDIPNPTGTAADANVIVDPNLIDPWGIAISASSPFWISDAGTGKATVYSATSNPAFTPSATVVNVPSASGGAARVTGQIANGTGGFAVGTGLVPNFIFCTEDGTLSGWNRTNDPNNAKVMVNNNGNAVYKGCTAMVTPNGPQLYAANFSAGTVDVFDTNWKPVTSGGFTDPSLPPGLNPFNVQVFGSRVFVTYALLGPDGVHDQAGAGNGQVDIYDWQGNLLTSLTDQSLNSPWGLEIAPEFFGDYSFTLLVGNFGDGTINAFDILSGQHVGTLSDSTGKPITLPGLWGLQFGNGGGGGNAKALYFAAGIGNEQHGLFGSITTP
jgi:uncharacterized protein (TIGR03118 family)